MVIAVALTSNLSLVAAPGYMFIPAKASGLPRDSVANVSQVVTADRNALIEQVGRIRGPLLKEVEAGLRRILDL